MSAPGPDDPWAQASADLRALDDLLVHPSRASAILHRMSEYIAAARAADTVHRERLQQENERLRAVLDFKNTRDTDVVEDDELQTLTPEQLAELQRDFDLFVGARHMQDVEREELKASLATVTKERDEARVSVDSYQKELFRWYAKVTASDEENARLTALLAQGWQPIDSDAAKFLGRLIGPCEGGATDHDWRNCIRCLTLHRVESHDRLAHKLIQRAIDRLTPLLQSVNDHAGGSLNAPSRLGASQTTDTVGECVAVPVEVVKDLIDVLGTMQIGLHGTPWGDAKIRSVESRLKAVLLPPPPRVEGGP